MDQILKWGGRNIIWLIGLLVALGGLIACVENTRTTVAGQEVKIISLFQKTSDLKLQDTVLGSRLDSIDQNLKEIKGDLKDIKALLYKPVVGDKIDKIGDIALTTLPNNNN